MKKKLLLLFSLIAGINLKTFATHDIGGSLTYQNVAPNTYLVTYSHYNWGGVPTTNHNIQLQISAPGCNFGRNMLMQYQTAWHAGIVPYVNGVPRTYKVSTLTATVTFTAAEAACKDWVLSVGPNWSGMTAANLAGNNPAIQIYTESTLKLDSNINNNSPVFDTENAPVLLAALHKPIILSAGVSDPDGDSLVYRMVALKEGPNQPVTNYKPIVYDHPQGQYFFNPNPNPPFSNPINPQGAHLPGLTTYQPDFPILSYNVDWGTGQQIIPVQKYFVLDSLNGALGFTPKDPGTSVTNAFLVAFQVDEYRKVNGVFTKIGSIRRETVIIVGGISANNYPRVSNPRVNNVPVQQNRGFTVGQGSTFSIQFDGSDTNAADSVFLKTNAATALPGATFTVTPGQRQSITVNWTPTAAQVRSQPYYLRIWAKDNATPFAGEHVETIAIRVTNSGGVLGVRADKNAGLTLVVYPNPFREQVTFRLKNNANLKEATLIICNAIGQEVDRLQMDQLAAGEQDLAWQKSARFPAGQYVARLVSNNGMQTIKFLKLH